MRTSACSAWTARDALGGGDQADDLQMPGAGGFQVLERADGAAAGGEHRIEHVDPGVGQPGRQALVVVDRLVVVLVALDPEMSDARVGQQAQEALDHAQPGPQYRHHGHLVADPQAARRLQRRLDRDLLAPAARGRPRRP